MCLRDDCAQAAVRRERSAAVHSELTAAQHSCNLIESLHAPPRAHPRTGLVKMSYPDGESSQRPMNGNPYGANGPLSARAPRPSGPGAAGGGRSRSGTTNGPPPASSSGARHVRIAPPPSTGGGGRLGPGGLQVPGGATARPQSNVGARLLKKRQSVSYHTAVSEGLVGGGGAAPPMPAMPLGLMPGGGPPQQQPQGQGLPRMAANQADDDLGRTGLDIDLLASESFKPEDCGSLAGSGRDRFATSAVQR